MNEEILKIDGITALLTFLAQNAHETYKSHAAQICGMLAENGGINQELVSDGCIDMLVEGLDHKSLSVKRNCSETLAFLLKDPNVRQVITNEKILLTLIGAY